MKNKSRTSKVIDKDDDFATLFTEKNHCSYDYYFDDGRIRTAFRKNGFFRIDAEYRFFRTLANPAAVNRLSNRVGERRSRFNKGTLDLYLRVFHEMLVADGVSHIFYDMVCRGKTMHEYWGAHLWPTIHCVRLPMERSIESYVEELHRPRGIELFLSHDAPQFYERGCLETLNPSPLDQLADCENYLPINIEPRTWTVSGRLLKEAVDFLSQLRYSQNAPSASYYDD